MLRCVAGNHDQNRTSFNFAASRVISHTIKLLYRDSTQCRDETRSKGAPLRRKLLSHDQRFQKFSVSITIDRFTTENLKQVFLRVTKRVDQHHGDAVGCLRRWFPKQPFGIQ